jgi:hypothetical protein
VSRHTSKSKDVARLDHPEVSPCWKTCPQVAYLSDNLSSDEEPFNLGRISFTVVDAEMDDVVDDNGDDSDYE